jgi:short-subunit dehydrogenase
MGYEALSFLERQMLKRAVVVGASSGIGAALVRQLAHEGYRVAAVARRQDVLDALCAGVNEQVGADRCQAFVHDVVDTESVSARFDEICTALDGLDLIVYSAGVMPRIEVDTWDAAIDRQIVEVNVIGAMNWLNQAAARFQIQGSGTIVGIGSVAGDRGRIGQPAYSASKAALHTYMEALRNRLSRHGVSVVTIKPGPVHTPMTKGLDKLPMAISANGAATGIVRAIANSSSTAYVPKRWMPIMTIIRSIPSVIFRRLSI